METGAIVAVTAHGGAAGDSASIQETLPAAGEAIAEQIPQPTAEGEYVVNVVGSTRLCAELLPTRNAAIRSVHQSD
jgi:hypothetical protein